MHNKVLSTSMPNACSAAAALSHAAWASPSGEAICVYEGEKHAISVQLHPVMMKPSCNQQTTVQVRCFVAHHIHLCFQARTSDES